MPEGPAEKPVARHTARRRFAHAKQAGGKQSARLTRVAAFKRLFSGRGDQRDADIVLVSLAALVELHSRPVFNAPVIPHEGETKESFQVRLAAAKETPEAFLLRSALANARCEVVQNILMTLEVSDEVLVALEKAARAEAQG